MNKSKIKSLIFNIAETILIFITGRLLNLPVNYIIMIMFTFMISRGFFGKALHYKTWYRCLIVSLLILMSLFVLFHINLIISIMFSIFSAFIMTGKSNIEDIYLWKPQNESKYKDIEEYIKYNFTNPALLNFEDNLKRRDDLLFLIYKYRFKEHLTFNEISEKLNGMENPRIVESLNQIALAMRISCGI